MGYKNAGSPVAGKGQAQWKLARSPRAMSGERAMSARQCGVCRFGDHQSLRGDIGPPSAACVLLFSRRDLPGIVASMEAMGEGKHVPLASAYCETCRKCTWLSRPANGIIEDCVDFMINWRAAEKIRAAIPILKRACPVKRSAPRADMLSKSDSDSKPPAPGSIVKTNKRSKCA